MHDAGAMRSVECRRDLDRDRQPLARRERALLEARGQCLALEKLHHEKRHAILLADVVEGADVRVGQLRDRAGLAIEALAELRVGGERGGKHLDRDRAIEARVACFVDFAHPARAKGGKDLVRAEARAWGQRHAI
jgi:hypothetical protein